MEWSDEGDRAGAPAPRRELGHPRGADTPPRPPSRPRPRRLVEQGPRPAPARQPREAHLARAACGESRHLCRRARARAGERHVRRSCGARRTECVLGRRRGRAARARAARRRHSKAPTCCSMRWRTTVSRIGRRSSCAGRLGLLDELGFGLDLTRCAATGSADDLIYVSPRTGRAVSRDSGRSRIATACSRCRRSCSGVRRASRTRAMRSRASS